MRNRGLGRKLLRCACAYGFKQLKLQRIYAEIKPENAPSIQIFEGIGFIFAGERDGLRTYNLKSQ